MQVRESLPLRCSNHSCTSGMWVAFLLLALGLSSCVEKREKPAVEKPYERMFTGDVQGTPRDTLLMGRLGEDTAMSCLQVITDSGDTLYVNKTSVDGVEGVMLGDVRNFEDRVMLTAMTDEEGSLFLQSFLNVSQLEGEWKNEKTQLSLLPDSQVTSTYTSYTHWRLDRCRLLLIGDHATEYGTTQHVDTATIELLDADSLHLTIARHGQLKLGK